VKKGPRAPRLNPEQQRALNQAIYEATEGPLAEANVSMKTLAKRLNMSPSKLSMARNGTRGLSPAELAHVMDTIRVPAVGEEPRKRRAPGVPEGRYLVDERPATYRDGSPDEYRPTAEERAVMNNPTGRVLLAMMSTFSPEQLEELLEAGWAIRKHQHPPAKEGLS
jgi:transcriptional regulator with XRE-family HTH domain